MHELNLQVVAPHYCYHSPDLTSPDGIRYVTWDRSSWYATMYTDHHRRRSVGHRTRNLLLVSTFEEYCLAWLLLLTLTKLGAAKGLEPLWQLVLGTNRCPPSPLLHNWWAIEESNLATSLCQRDRISNHSKAYYLVISAVTTQQHPLSESVGT